MKQIFHFLLTTHTHTPISFPIPHEITWNFQRRLRQEKKNFFFQCVFALLCQCIIIQIIIMPLDFIINSVIYAWLKHVFLFWKPPVFMPRDFYKDKHESTCFCLSTSTLCLLVNIALQRYDFNSINEMNTIFQVIHQHYPYWNK